jgi:glycosyltransferase involved in cell wall biosynthesis
VKPRVLQFIGSFHQGGSERQAVALSRMLAREGSFDVRIATLNNEGVLKADVDALVPAVAEFKLTSFYNANFLRQVRRCSHFLRDNKIDIVHTHDFYTNVFGMAAATLARVPVKIASKRETGGMRSTGQEFVEKLALGRADATVVNANAVRDHLTSRGISGSKIKVVYNGVDSDHRTATRRMPDLIAANGSIRPNSRFITLVANLRHPVKNIPMLLRAAKRVSEEDENVHFIIAGEGGLRDELQGLAVRLGVARIVHFIGRCDDVPSLLASSDICVLTSTAEGFSNSLVEYMAAGKPVVATDVGGAREVVIDGETGYLVAADDDDAMAERLFEILGDDTMAAAFGAAGSAIVKEEFSTERQMQATIDLYTSLLREKAVVGV